MKKNIIVPVFTILAAGALLFGTTSAFAQTGNGETFVQKLAQKLGIEETKVQTAVDELQKERQTEMQKTLEVKLTQAVKDGKITEAQKTAILAKHKEMQAKRESMRDTFKDLTPEERREIMEKQREELKAWADEQNIDLQEYFGFKGKNGMGMKMRFMR